MKKVLVTGASGFVGNYVVENLQKTAEYEIYGTRCHSSDNNYGIEMYTVRMQDANEVDKVIKKIRPDYIYHLAAQSSVSESLIRPDETHETNVGGAINLLNAIKEYAPKCKTLLVGSSEEYGDTAINSPVLSEDSECMPKNEYGKSKLEQNMAGCLYVKQYQLDIVMSRSFNHFGPGQSPKFVISDFCRQVVQIENGSDPIIKVGNLNSYRDFCDVRDIVSAYRILIERGESGLTYNVGSGISIKISELLDRIISKSKANNKIEIIVDPEKFRQIDTPEIRANIERIKKLGWEPRINIDTTIDDTLNYYRQKIKK